MADRTHGSSRDPAKSTTPIGKVVRRLRKIIGASIIFSFAVNLIILISPLYMMQIYNRVLPSRSESTLIMLTALVFFALAALAILEAVRSLVFVRIGGAVERDLNEIVIDSSFQNMLQNYSTSYDHALRDFDTIRTFVWSHMPSNLLDMLWVPLFVACVFFLHPLLGADRAGRCGDAGDLRRAAQHGDPQVAAGGGAPQPGTERGGRAQPAPRPDPAGHGHAGALQAPLDPRARPADPLAGAGGRPQRDLRRRHQVDAHPAPDRAAGGRRHAGDQRRRSAPA